MRINERNSPVGPRIDGTGGVRDDGTAGQGKPIVSLDMAVNKIDVEYRPQLYSGGLGPAVKGGWQAGGR